MVTKEQVYEQLKTVKDPELFINIVDLGLVYEVKISNKFEIRNSKFETTSKSKTTKQPQYHVGYGAQQKNENSPVPQSVRGTAKQRYSVFILLTLTSPGCPLADTFEGMITQAVKKIPEVDEVNVELTWEPAWNQDMMSEEAKAELGFF